VQLLEAALWGFVGGAALMIGALIGLSLPVPIRIVGVVMGFRVQVLISAVAFELTGAAYDRAGPVPAVRGLSAGALTFLRRRLGDSAIGRKAAMRAGASGFLLKDVRPEQLAEAVRVVAAGETLLAPAITERLVQRLVGRPRPGATKPHELKSLTERELAVHILMARGRSNAEIASALFLSETTVKSHVTTCSANSLCAIAWRVLALSSVGAARTAGARDQFSASSVGCFRGGTGVPSGPAAQRPRPPGKRRLSAHRAVTRHSRLRKTGPALTSEAFERPYLAVGPTTCVRVRPQPVRRPEVEVEARTGSTSQAAFAVTTPVGKCASADRLRAAWSGSIICVPAVGVVGRDAVERAW
jgi:hypothetical protein